MPESSFFLLISYAAAFLLIDGGIVFGTTYSLDHIKNKTVGNGQHGTARFTTPGEIKKTYKHIAYRPGLWRRGISLPTEQRLILGTKGVGSHLIIGASGIGKTAHFLYPNIEYACACGMSYVATDTKGDLYRNTAAVAKDSYGYNISVIDLRNPTRSDEWNMLTLVNKYMDMWKKNGSLTDKTRAEKYAKITAITIIYAGAEQGTFAQNSFFYDAAEGLVTSVILLLAESGEPAQRHIVSVFKLNQELVAPSLVKGAPNKFQQLINILPEDHKARWFVGAVLSTSEQAMASVMSTAMSRLIALDIMKRRRNEIMRK